MTGDLPLWLFGDQLGRHFHSTPEHRHRPILLIESANALRRKEYHRQKLHLVLAAMRALAEEMPQRVTLLRAPTYAAALREYGGQVLVHEPGSHAADALVRGLQRDGVVVEILPTPGFTLSRNEFADWVGQRTRFLMEDFYRDQRRRFGVLLEPDGEPVSGRWNLDRENRAAPPSGSADLGVPTPWQPKEGAIDEAVRSDLDAQAAESGARLVGEDGPRRFAVTHAEAGRALRRFLTHRLPTFGTHQDAMLTGDWAMSHALLSVPLNLGLLDPLHVVRKAAECYHDGSAPLSAVEGFVRQVLGWREWVWQLYWHLGPKYLRSNHLQARRALPDWWRELHGEQVQAACLRSVLDGLRRNGYDHHIQRLMVLGNHALQRGYQPAALTEWFATRFVDGFPWVMPANVVGMSQYADGGVVATKPYASGGAYLNRMSDYCGDCAFDPKVRLGENACPFTAGYWAFLHRNAERLRDNHRMKQPLAAMRKLSDLDDVVAQERDRTTF